MLDTLHRSRLQFPGMGMGFIKRMLDEAISHSKQRNVGGKTLWNYDQVQNRLSRLQVNYTICSSLCVAGSEMAGLDKDLTALGMEANIIKCVTTDLMQESSQSLLQLVGAKGYKLNHVAGRSTVDSRPFQIFEGSNDILYIQICDALLKKMTASKQTNLHHFLTISELTRLAAERIKDSTNFSVISLLTQRKQVELGLLISRVVTLNFVLKMDERGFSKELLEAAISALKDDISSLSSSYQHSSHLSLSDEYENQSYWLDFVKS